MLLEKKVSVRGEWAKINEDIKDKDVITIKDAGTTDNSGTYGERQVFTVETRNGDKILSFNQTSINNLVDAYGGSTEAWIGKGAIAYVVKQSIAGSLKNVCYLVGEGWYMDDEGRVFKDYDPAKGEDPRPEDIKI